MSLSNIFLIIGALLVVAWAARQYLGRSKRGRCYLLIWDRRVLRVELVTVVNEGVQDLKKKIYPSSELMLAELRDGTQFYLLGADHVALSTHQALEAARLGMLPRMLFESGGDMKRWLEYAALILPLAAAVWLTLKIGDFQTTVNRMDASVQSVQTSVNNLMLLPKPPEKPLEDK